VSVSKVKPCSTHLCFAEYGGAEKVIEKVGCH